MAMFRTLLPCLVTSLLTPLGLTARAQEEPLLGDEQALQEERTPEERFRTSSDPHEARDQSYFFLGGSYRFAMLPPFLMRAYGVTSDRAVRTGKAVVAELGYRRRGFQVLANAGFLKLDVDAPFRLRRDPIEDTEWLEARFKSLLLTAAFTWSTHFTDWLQLEYGFEAGAAVLFGDLTRTEAVRRADGKWERCSAWASVSPDPADMLGHNPLSPSPTPEQVRYCERPRGDDPAAPPPDSDAADEEGAHYGVKAKRGLGRGGVPRVLPVLGPRLSLRLKPARQVVLRVDVPLPVFPFGFMGGVSAQYGF
jgi:hypothetical protein